MMFYSLILASSVNGGIGYDGSMAWNIRDEIDLFKKITTDVNCYLKKNAVIMGRNTWNSLPYKPLKNRINIVLSSNKNGFDDYGDDVKVFNHFDDALGFCEDNIYIDKVFVIGGKSLYDLCLNNDKYFKRINKIYLSVVYKNYHCDTFINLKELLRKNRNYDINTVLFRKEFIHLRLTVNE